MSVLQRMTTRCGRVIEHVELERAINTLHRTLGLPRGYMWVSVTRDNCFEDKERWTLESPEQNRSDNCRYVATGLSESDLYWEIYKIQQGISLFFLYND
jgi:hypothetical protein